jgi:LacI family transcriptional regulator
MTHQRDRGTITITDIARMAEVSKKTVSRVINDLPSVKESTRLRVKKIIEETGFVPNPQAQALALRRSLLVGLVYDNPSPQYITNIQIGILKELEETRYQLVLRPAIRTDPDCHDQILSFVRQHNPFGLIFVPSMSEDPELTDKLDELDCHYVRMACVELGDPSRQIKTNDADGAKLAGDHLARLGHTKIAHIHGPESFLSTHERRAGFQEALKHHGIELKPEFTVEGAYTYASGVDCAKHLFRLTDRPTAIFAGNDEMAMGVYRAAQDAGLRIPHDLSVVGYDDTTMASRVSPPMTSVHSPIREAARAIAKLLITSHKSKEHKAQDARSTIHLDLNIRQSTAPPATE